MLPAAHRFHLRHTPRFFLTSRRVFSPYLTLWYQASDTSQFQAAFIVPKKLLKKSTDRHRLLRQLRASTQNFITTTAELPSAQVVLMPTKQTLQLSSKQLQTEVLVLLQRIVEQN